MTKDVEKAIGLLERAHVEMCEAVKRQWEGKHALKISIPVRLDHDSDVIVCGAISEALDVLRAASLVPRSLPACVCQVDDRLVQEWVSKAREVAKAKGYVVGRPVVLADQEEKK